LLFLCFATYKIVFLTMLMLMWQFSSLVNEHILLLREKLSFNTQC